MQATGATTTKTITLPARTLKGNFGKTWNPNHRHSYLPTVLMGALYFGAEELDEIYTSFDYDAYMEQLEAYGFTNIIGAWSAAGRSS